MKIIRFLMTILQIIEHLSEYPLSHISLLNEKADRRLERHPYTLDELGRLLAAAETGKVHHVLTGYERALVYRLAVDTGLRWSEIRSLTRASFDFRSETATVTIAAAYAKDGKDDTLPLRPALAAALKAYMALFLPSANAFAKMGTDYRGKRVTYTLCRDRQEAQKQANRLEAHQDEIKKGLRPLPSVTEKVLKRSYDEVAEEYLEHGKMKGGHHKRPWSENVARRRRYYLEWWKKALKLKNMIDLLDRLSDAEAALNKHQIASGCGGKTLSLYREGLFAFCNWCVTRKYFKENPFKALENYDTTPQAERRALPMKEIQSFLETVPFYRQILYEFAFSSGLRVEELRSLEESSVDLRNGGVWIDADDDKSKEKRLQPICSDLLKKLDKYAKSGEAKRLYAEKFAKARRSLRSDLPDRPLFYVPAETAKVIKQDFERAGIPVVTKEGYLDFHACRTAYINLLIEGGVDIKTVQGLARHKNPLTTLKTYGRFRTQHLKEAAEQLGKSLFQVKNLLKNRNITEEGELLDITKNAIPLNKKDCAENELVGRGGFEPP